MNIKNLWWLPAVSLFLGGFEARAADESEPLSLSTDRPSFSDGAVTVPAEHLQFEFGLAFEHSAESEALSLAMPLLRYGLSEGIEARLAVPAISMVWPADGTDETEVGNLDLGFRFIYRLADAATAGFQPFVSFPLRSEEYDSAGVDAGVKVLWAVALSDWLELSGNLGLIFTGLGSDGVQDQHYLASLVLGFALIEDWGAFVEGFALIPDRDPGSAAAGLNVGAAWRVSSRWQVDLFVGSDLNAGDSVLFGLGGAYLW